MPNLDLRPGTLNVTTYYKGDYSIRFTFTQGGSVYPLTDVTAATFVISEKNGTAALTLSSGSGLTINGAGGYIDMAITNAQIVALYSQEYNYEFSLTLNSTTVWPILDSVFIVSEDGQTDATVSDINITLDGTTVDVSVIAPVTSLGGGTWGDITGILSDQTDLQTALDGKVDENAAIVAATKTKITYDTKGLVTAGADAEIADITGLQSALDGKAAAAHTHPLSDLTQSGATTGQVPKWDGAAWVPDDEAGGADGNGIYTGSGTVDISGGDVEATLSNHAGGLKLKYADGVTGIEIVNGATPADSYAQLINGEDTAYVYADIYGAALEATGGLSIRVSPSGIEINGPSGSGTAGQVWTADGAGYGDFQDASGGSVSIIDITYTDMETAIAGATLTPGQFYRITDASGTDLGFVCQAVKEDEITVNGTGGYLNADFQAVGDYSGAESPSYIKYYIYYFDQTGPFTVGETITGDDNGSVAVVISDDGVELLEISVSSGDWSTETTFSGGTSGNTATIDSYEETAPVVQIGIWRRSFEALTITYTNLSGGTFAVGDTITGGTTGATAVIVTDDGAAEMTAYMTSPGVVFDGSEVLDNGNGVTADQDGSATAPTIVLGNIVIFNLFHYQLTDATLLDGNSPEENTDAYTLLDKATANVGYITAWDKSDFNFTANEVIARSDIYSNILTGNVDFPFGNEKIYNNYAFFASINCKDYPGTISGNTIFGSGQLSLDNLSSENSGVTDCLLYQRGHINVILGDESYVDANVIQLDGQLSVSVGNNCSIKGNSIGVGALFSEIVTGADTLIENNILENGATLTGITAGANCSISRNKIGQGATLGGTTTMGDGAAFNDLDIRANKQISNKTLDASVTFSDKIVQLTTDTAETYSANVEGNRTQPGFSDIPGTLDITGLTALDFTAAWAQYRGIYNLTSSNATETISADSLTNFPTLFPFRLIPAAGLELTLTCTAAGSATNGSIVGSSGTIVLNGDNGDFVELESDSTGTFVRVKNLQIYA